MEENRSIEEMASEIQISKIAKPIYENLQMYGLENTVTFIFQGHIMDVDILDPKFEVGLKEKQKDIDSIISLLGKHGLPVPHEIHLYQIDLQRKLELKSSIRYFENWLLGHLMYLDLEGLTIETIYYSPRKGFLVKFRGLDLIRNNTKEFSINVLTRNYP